MLCCHTWFGGQYNGGNYYIKNIAINSNCYNVGVFGTTAGATIENIMLYSDNKRCASSAAQVIRRLPVHGRKISISVPMRLGGLVGIAYEYYQDNLGKSTIQNCAIAGYTDCWTTARTKQQLGEAVVGGLIGVSNR